MSINLAFRIAAIAGLAGYFPAASAGPFGYEQGMTRETVKKISKEVEDYKSTIKVIRPPNTNETIDSVYVNFSKKSGLCQINAFAKPLPANSIEREFTETVQALSQKYGKSQINFVPNGNVREVISADRWYKAVLEKKGRLRSIWKGDQQHSLPDKLQVVEVSAYVTDQFPGDISEYLPPVTLMLSYWFSNFEDCVSEAKAERSKGL